MTEGVRLKATDTDDLKVISALVQDALVPLSDMTFIKEAQQFVLALNRFRWEHTKEKTRTHALLTFGHVDGVQTRNIDRKDPTEIMNLLGVQFEEGFVLAAFSAGGLLRLKASELECTLQDVGEPWPASSRPAHDDT
jgi:hypothetical protein